MRTDLFAAAVVLVLVGCDGGPAPGADGGGGDAGMPSVTDPATPVLTPCPAGWRQETGPSGIASCTPWPETGYDEHCAADAAHFPGTPGCARVGTACAADGWPSDLPTDRPVVYVDDDAAPGGDGSSRARALRTLGEAVTAAPTGAVIAIATGRYDEFVTVGAGLTLWGACVDGTRIANAVATQDHGVIDLVGAGAGVRNLGIDPSARLGVYSLAPDTSVRDVVIAGTALAGFWADVGPTTLTNVVVRDTASFAVTHFGSAIEIEYGQTATLDHVVVERPANVALYVDMGSVVDATDVVLRGGMQGGVFVQDGARVTFHRVEVAGTTGYGIVVQDASSSLDATDLVVDDCRGPDGDAFVVQTGAGATLTRVHALRFGRRGFVTAAGSESTLTDVLIEQGGRGPTDNGTGISELSGSIVHVSRVLVDHASTEGVYLTDPDTRLDAADLTVRAVQGAPSTGLAGDGVLVLDGASADLTRVLLDQARHIGLGLAAANVTATDLHVRDTQPAETMEEGQRMGRGIELQRGTTLMITRGVVEQSRSAGLLVDSSQLGAVDLVVQDTLPEEVDQSVGIALWAQTDSVISLTNTWIERARFGGVAAVGATLTADGLVVDGITMAECASTTCPMLGGGFGVISMFGGAVTLDRFRVHDTAVCGVLVGDDDPSRAPTGMDLTNGEVDTAPVGACVQTTGFDPERLHHMVVFRDVGVPLQATSYQLPTLM